MEIIHFTGNGYVETLPSAKTVCVGLSDDGAHWSFDIGTPNVPEDRVHFALSAEAFEAVERIVAELRKPSVRLWRYIVTYKEPSDE